MISYLIHIFFSIIYLIMLTVIILSWIPIFNTRKEPLATFVKIYERIIAPFRAIIPPFGMIDISPIAAFFVLGIIEFLTTNILSKFGL